MLIVSSGEFRSKQKEYLDRIDQGEEIVLQRGKNKSYKIIPVEADDTLMSKEAFFAMVQERSEAYHAGKAKTYTQDEVNKMGIFDDLE